MMKETIAEIARADFITCYCEETGKEYALWGQDLAERTKQRFARNQPPEKERVVVVSFTATSTGGMDSLYRLICEVKESPSLN